MCPDVEINSIPFFQKLPQKVVTTGFDLKVSDFKLGQRVGKYLGYDSFENLSPRPFKSRPIWSHCQTVAQDPLLYIEPPACPILSLLSAFLFSPERDSHTKYEIALSLLLPF